MKRGNLLRALKVTVASIAVMLLTTGCVKFNMDLEVKANDTVSGTIVFAVAKGLAELSDDSGTEGSAPETDTLLEGAENVKVEPFDDGDFVGSTYTFENVPLETFQPKVGEDSSFGIARDGDNIVVSGVLEMTSDQSTQEDNPFGDAFLQGVLASSDIKISITLPGEIKESNGTVDGQTISWKGTFGKNLEISAIAYAPKTNPVFLIIGISLAAGILVWFIVWSILRVRQKSSSSSPAKKSNKGTKPEKLVVTSKVGLSDADIKVLESEYATNPERFAMDYLSMSEFKKWRAAGEPSLKPWIGMGMVNFKKWLDLHK